MEIECYNFLFNTYYILCRGFCKKATWKGCLIFCAETKKTEDLTSYLLLQGRIIGLIVAEIKELGQLAKEDRSILASSFRKGTKVGYILSLGE